MNDFYTITFVGVYFKFWATVTTSLPLTYLGTYFIKTMGWIKCEVNIKLCQQALNIKLCRQALIKCQHICFNLPSHIKYGDQNLADSWHVVYFFVIDIWPTLNGQPSTVGRKQAQRSLISNGYHLTIVASVYNRTNIHIVIKMATFLN